MTELTRDLVRKAPQIVNPLKQRELSLRGLHLNQLPLTDSSLWTSIVSNFDTLDLSDNLIQWLDAPSIMTIGERQEKQQNEFAKHSQQQQQQNNNSGNNAKSAAIDAEVDDFLSFLNLDPNAAGASTSSSTTTTSNKQQQQQLTSISTTTKNNTKLTPIRLTSLLLHKNGLKGISKSFANQFKSSLTSLALHGNEISELSSCDIFGSFKVLERLSLIHNPVRDRQGYRFYVIGTCSKTLKLLDFQKVRDEEREQGKEFKKQIVAQQQQQEQDSASTVDAVAGGSLLAAGGATVGAGRRAARKAALLAVASGNENQQQQDNSIDTTKRSRDATEQQLLANNKKNPEEVQSISTKIGQVHADSRSGTNKSDESINVAEKKKKSYTRDELMEMLESAATLEEMEEIEKMMNELD